MNYVLSMDDKRDEMFEEDDQWFVRYLETWACSANPFHLGPAWREAPEAIDVVMAERPESLLPGGLGTAIGVMHKSLYTVLRPFMKHFLIGKATWKGARASEYISFLVPPVCDVDMYRGKEGAHWQCLGCGEIVSASMHQEAVLRLSLGDRRVHGSQGLAPLIDPALVTELDLRDRFKHLKFQKVKVLEAPLDGDVLPGDPGWDGTFRPQWAKLKPYGIKPPRTARRSTPPKR